LQRLPLESGVRRVGWFRVALLAISLVPVFCVTGCRSAPPPEHKALLIGWRPIGSWSGHGNMQTESFNIEGTQWRIKWETKGEASPGAGDLVIMVHSAVSGRPIALGVEHKGNGHGVEYVTEDPRLYHLVIESSGLEWAFSVDEAVQGYSSGTP
jgi:hypothetical protein